MKKKWIIPTLILSFSFIASAEELPSPYDYVNSGRLAEASVLWFARVAENKGSQALASLELAIMYAPNLQIVYKSLETIINTHTDETVVYAALLNRAELQSTSSAIQEALLTYSLCIQKRPDDWQTQARYIRLLLLRQDWASVKSSLENVLNLNPPDQFISEFALVTSYWLASTGLYKESLINLQNQVLNRKQVEPEAYLFSYLLLKHLKNDPEANRILSVFSQAYPKHELLQLVQNKSLVKLDPLFFLFGPLPANVELTQAQKPIIKNTERVTIQLGIFARQENAKKLQETMKKKFPAIQTQIEKEDETWRVFFLVKEEQDAEKLVLQLKDNGVDGFISLE